MTEETSNQEGEQEAADDWAAAMAEQTEAEATTTDQTDVDDLIDSAQTEADTSAEKDDGYTPAPVEDFQNEGTGAALIDPDSSLDVILDIPVSMSMEIGRTQMAIRNLLQLNQGSVVELDRLAGEPLDVLVNGTLIAHGEVVVVNEKFGIRLTDVISPAERVKKLN